MAADVLSPAVYSGAGSQTGYPCVKLQGGIQFTGHQQSKGNSYRVDVFVQVESKETFARPHLCAAPNVIRSALLFSMLTLRTAS